MEIVLQLGVNERKLIRTSLFLVWFRMRARNMATIWPNTVAAAAPWIPIFGTPNRPKIRMGSSIILMMAPVPCVIIQ